jgi:hypothetical protein
MGQEIKIGDKLFHLTDWIFSELNNCCLIQAKIDTNIFGEIIIFFNSKENEQEDVFVIQFTGSLFPLHKIYNRIYEFNNAKCFAAANIHVIKDHITEFIDTYQKFKAFL